MEYQKDTHTVAEFISVQKNLRPDSYALIKSEIPFSQIKSEQASLCSSVTRTVSPQGRALSLNEDTFQEEYIQSQSELFPSTVKSERSSPSNPCSVKSEDSVQSTTTASPGLTAELENFQDLTAWCHSTPKAPKMSVLLETDELNTPDIELGDFVFQSPTLDQTNDDCYGLLNVASEGIINPEGLYAIGASDILINKYDNNNIDSHIFGSMDNNCINKSEASYQYNIINDMGGGEVEKNIKTTTLLHSYNLNNVFTNTKCTDNISVASTSNAEMYNTISTGLISEETSQTSSHDDVFAFSQSPHLLEQLTYDTPLNLQDAIILPLAATTCLPTPPPFANRKGLQLDFSNIWTTEKISTPTVMDTPEVINTALAMDKTFNLINFITNDTVVIEEDVQTESVQFSEQQLDDDQSLSTVNDPDPSYTPSEASDDEDYEPPWKKQRKTTISRSNKTKRNRLKSIVEDADSEMSNVSSIELVIKVAKRGRPPKTRNVSISSESTNADTDVSKYRELRDKNNEASRRSRYNRKQKEQQLEDEANDLDSSNRRLKVRVHELERLVNTMRTNLMQLLMKK